MDVCDYFMSILPIWLLLWILNLSLLGLILGRYIYPIYPRRHAPVSHLFWWIGPLGEMADS